MKEKILFVCLLISLLIFSSLVSAVTVNSVEQGNLYPGEQTDLSVSLENNLNDDVTDVSLRLDFSGVIANQFITIGSSEDSVDEIREGKDKSFNFVVKSSQDIQPGDYNIPYIITYTDIDDDVFEKKGTIGISVDAKTELDFSVKTENPVLNQRGEISLIATNKGFGDIKFLSVKLSPQGFALLSSEDVYVGSISSDDFESATYDVLFKDINSRLVATVTYKDFNNNDVTQNINLPIKVYTPQEAAQAGIIQSNNTFIYVIIVVVIVIVFFIYRAIRKRRKKNNKATSQV